MKTLILASELTAGTPKIRQLVKDEPKGTILIIPTASRGEGWDPIYEKHYLPFEEMGYTTKEFDLKGKTPKETEENLNKAVAVYVCGGNTFVLLEHMRKSGFSKLINKRLEEGLVYIGSSAGIVVTTPDITYAGTIDDPSIADLNNDYTGLGLIDYSIVPHIDHIEYGEPCQKLYQSMINNGQKVEPLRDDQVIYIKQH